MRTATAGATMIRVIRLGSLALLLSLAGCNQPTDIVFGTEPLKQVVDQADQFKKLSEQDRIVLLWYLAVAQIGGTSVAGRTVGEVLAIAKAGPGQVNKLQSDEWVRRAHLLTERKIVADKIAASVVVTVRSTEVLPKDFDARRVRDMLVVHYFIENKTDQDIRQVKGEVTFFDSVGDRVGSLPVDIGPIRARSTLDSTGGVQWGLNSVMMGSVERIAARHNNDMTSRFEGQAIAFFGGEVLKAPPLKADVAKF